MAGLSHPPVEFAEVSHSTWGWSSRYLATAWALDTWRSMRSDRVSTPCRNRNAFMGDTAGPMSGVADRLAVERPGVGAHLGSPRVEVVGVVHERDLDAHLGQRVVAPTWAMTRCATREASSVASASSAIHSLCASERSRLSGGQTARV